METPPRSKPPEGNSEPARPDRVAESQSSGRSYFDASAWSDLVREPDRDVLVARLQLRPAPVLASVISAGEILRTSDALLRKELCSTMLNLHGDGPLLESPLDLARAAAIAHLRGDGDMLLPQTSPGRSLLSFLRSPDSADRDTIGAWLGNSDANLERFLSVTKPDKPNLTIRYYSPDVLSTEPFLKLLLTLPPAIELGLALPQCRELYERVDIWRALAATLRRASRLASVVNEAYAPPHFKDRLEALVGELVARAPDALAARNQTRVVSMHLTPHLGVQLRALEQAQRRLERAWWGPREISWEERDPQEQAFLSIQPVGALWKRVGRKKVKIRPKQRRTLPVSVRFPPDLYQEVTAYAERLGADRTYVIVECVRQTLDADREWKREWAKRTG